MQIAKHQTTSELQAVLYSVTLGNVQAFWNKYCHFFVKTSFSVPLSNFRHGSSQSKRTSRGPEQGYQSFQRNLLTRFQHTSSISLNFFQKLLSGGPVSCLTWTPNKKGSVLASKEARTLPFRKPFKQRTTCLTDKTNHPVKGLSLNRSQCGSCSTKYDTPAGT